jgi:hypothetical protein
VCPRKYHSPICDSPPCGRLGGEPQTAVDNEKSLQRELFTQLPTRKESSTSFDRLARYCGESVCSSITLCNVWSISKGRRTIQSSLPLHSK